MTRLFILVGSNDALFPTRKGTVMLNTGLQLHFIKAMFCIFAFDSSPVDALQIFRTDHQDQK